jgi:PTH2 family peptidyl-tRNA hydrolase
MYKQVILMRTDLRNSDGHKVRTGKLIAQGAHASMKVFFDNIEYCDNGSMKINNITPDMEEWIKGSFTKIVVGVTLDELDRSIFLAGLNNLPFSYIKDAGFTEFKEPTVTCGAIGPCKIELFEGITDGFKLL